MALLPRKLFSSFVALNLTQFFSALNDNVYKLLLIFFLIDLQGKEASNTILSLAGAVFVIPFLLFSALAGTLADRFSKRAIIYFTRVVEILSTALGVIAFSCGSAWGGYVVLFLMATHSALFSPCKYGIIPEIVSKERISHCNGILTATTYLAIILGTFTASFLTEVTHRHFFFASWFCVGIACVGALCSLGLEKTFPQAAGKKIAPFFLADILATLRRARQSRYLLTTLVCGSYFLFMGAYTQLNIIPFAMQSLSLSEVAGGYLFLMTAIGIGLGSFTAGKLSGKEVELGFVPFAALGVMACLIWLYGFSAHFFFVAPALVCLGFFGGFYIVPIDAFIQFASPSEDRGQNVATANFLSFLGVVVASGLLAFLGNGLRLSAAQGFLVIGLSTLGMALVLFYVYANQVFRLLLSLYIRLFCHVTFLGKEHLSSHTPTVLVAARRNWMDTCLVLATLPRLLRSIIPLQPTKWHRSPLYRLLNLIPIRKEALTASLEAIQQAIQEEMTTGHSVCVMYPPHPHTAQVWETEIRRFLHPLHIPMISITLATPGLENVRGWKKVRALRQIPITITYERLTSD